MFLTPGLRIAASTCVGLAIVNVAAMVAFLLDLPDPPVEREVYLTYAILLTQAGIIGVGIGLFRMYAVAWIAFWFVGFAAISVAGEQARWQIMQKDDIGSIPFFVVIDLTLWYVSTGVCLVLPSSRKFYFDEPSSIRLHKKVVHDEAVKVGRVSGRPRKPVGVVFVAWVGAAVSLGIFLFAMSVLAESESSGPGEPASTGLAAWLILYATCIALSSFGLLSTQKWGWWGMLGCATGAILAALGMHARGPDKDSIRDLTLTTPLLLLCVVWCGTAICYLLLPKVRHPYFHGHRSSSGH